MGLFKRLDTWHQTKIGLFIFGLAELALGYVFLSWAIDKGSLLDWFLTIVLLVGGVQNITKLLIKLSGNLMHHGR